MELYPARKSKSLDLRLFQSPTAAYRGTPFWCWNSKLDRAQLHRQLTYFQQMGMGGVHIHCRTGLETRYLGPAFMSHVRASMLHAKKLGLLTWLYDEDRWPSGFAGGLVTRKAANRAKHLLFTCQPYGSVAPTKINISSAHGARTGQGTLLARYAIALNDAGAMTSYRRLPNSYPLTSIPHETLWYAYLESAQSSPWFNNQAYADTLQKSVTEAFIQSTHEPYRRLLGNEFGHAVPAIFTDEPQFARKEIPADPFSHQDIILPFTTDLPKTFRATYGEDLLDSLPEIIWPRADEQPSPARYQYHDHVAERFTSAFADTLAVWCKRHGIALTGHMMGEHQLRQQTVALGEAMRSYRAFDIPGIDMLCDSMELTTAKQCQSAKHQFARPGMLSELYGVTGWHFDFPGHKRQGDWQAALGVTVRVHHLAWVSMKGEAKRDYPASIFYQSPWFQEYKTIEDHFSRVHTVLTRGKPLVRVGVIHPVESFWLAFGAGNADQLERENLESSFDDLTNWLLFGAIDFDFICESLLPAQSPANSTPSAKSFPVGHMNYDVIIVPGLKTIRATTLARLEHFVAAGGTVLFAGRIPTHVDALPCTRPAELAARSTHLNFSRAEILATLEPFRSLRITSPTQNPSFLHQLRQDGTRRSLFICNTDRDNPRHHTTIEMPGTWSLRLLDTHSGVRSPLATRYAPGKTFLDWDCPPHGSILLEYSPGRRSKGLSLREKPLTEIARLPDPHAITLSEPNVLLFDQAEWRLNNGPWQPREEILRLLNLARHRFHLPPIDGNIAQPYADRAPSPILATLHLRFQIHTAIPLTRPQLALEDAASTRITLDHQPIPSHPRGYFTDESIQTVPLPDLSPGTHTLTLSFPFSRTRQVEWSYLLGDFGVELRGSHARLTAPIRNLAWGDWTTQGLPFYAGNVTYHCALATPRRGQPGPLTLEVFKFKAPTLRAALDGRDLGPLGLAPYRVALPARHKGQLAITAFGNRANSFGIVHNTLDRATPWSATGYGPEAWRTTGAAWTYEYKLQPTGILYAPRLLK